MHMLTSKVHRQQASSHPPCPRKLVHILSRSLDQPISSPRQDNSLTLQKIHTNKLKGHILRLGTQVTVLLFVYFESKL